MYVAGNEFIDLLVQVGSLNFDSNYQNKEEPVTPAGKGYCDNMLCYHVIDDIFTKPYEVYEKVLSHNGYLVV